jgi:phospholipid-binding lipoprotein MlaA
MEKIFFTFLTITTLIFLFGCSQTTPHQEKIVSGQEKNESVEDQITTSQSDDIELEDINPENINTADELGDDEDLIDASDELEDEFEELDESIDFDENDLEDLDASDDSGDGNFGDIGDDVYDPFESYNRGMTAFNDGLFLYLLDPVATGYSYVVPEGGRKSVNNFLNNLLYPVRLVNTVFQAKFACAGKETLRFTINCTIGILGLFDPAKDWFGIEACEEDFGQTLGFWGVGPGPHFVLPFFGPSNLRDMFSLYPDSFYDPIAQLKPLERQILVTGYKYVNKTSLHLGEYQAFKKDAYDYYLFFRDAYEQHRQKLIEE